MLDRRPHQKLRRFAIWYLLARQALNKNAPLGAFFISVGHFVGHSLCNRLSLPAYEQITADAYCSPTFMTVVLSRDPLPTS